MNPSFIFITCLAPWASIIIPLTYGLRLQSLALSYGLRLQSLALSYGLRLQSLTLSYGLWLQSLALSQLYQICTRASGGGRPRRKLKLIISNQRGPNNQVVNRKGVK